MFNPKVSRREFFTASAKVGGIAAATIALAATGVYLLKRPAKTMDSLTRALEVYGKNFPFSIEYLERILKEGMVTKVATEQIIAYQEGLGKLYALQAFGLVQRVMRKNEMSQRYSDFLANMGKLIMEGKIKFKTMSLKGRDIDFYYDVGQLTIYADPERKMVNDTIAESSIIHELTHAYQDYQKRTLRYSLFETEAHLAQSDFIFHVQPELLSEFQWLQFYPGNDGFKYKFMFPRQIIRSATNFSKEDHALADLILQARRNYLLIRAIQGSADYQKFRMLNQQIPPGAPANAIDRGLINLIESGKISVQVKPLKEHLVCVTGKKAKGNLVTCRPTNELIEFSTSVQFMVLKLWERGEFETARKISNFYLLEVWQEERHSLLEHPGLDQEMVLTGIK